MVIDARDHSNSLSVMHVVFFDLGSVNLSVDLLQSEIASRITVFALLRVNLFLQVGYKLLNAKMLIF